jgi:signal transduction histidine kinase
MKPAAVLALLFFCLSACRQSTAPGDHLPTNHMLVLDSGWTFRPDGTDVNPDSIPATSGSIRVDPTQDIVQFLKAHPAPLTGWLHNSFTIPKSWPVETYALAVLQTVASEIYLDGKLVAQYGTIAQADQPSREYDPILSPVPINLVPGKSYAMDVRIGIAAGTRYTTIFESPNPLFRAEIKPFPAALAEHTRMHVIESGFLRLNVGINIMLFIVHFFFYILNRQQIANLYLSLSGLVYIVGYSLQLVYFLYMPNHTDRYYLGNVVFLLFQLGNTLLFFAVHQFLERKRDLAYWVLVTCFFIALVLNLSIYPQGWQLGGATYQILTSVVILLTSLAGLRQNKKGALAFFIGSVFSLVCFVKFATMGTFEQDVHFLRQLSTGRYLWFMFFWLSITASVSAYLAWDFSLTSKALARKLREVKDLSEKNVAIEKEKQDILAAQNQELERQVLERTAELNQSLNELKATQSQLIQSEKMASLGELTAGIAHEIQNPLNFVNNFSDLNKELIGELQEELKKGDLREASSIAENLKDNEEKINLHGRRADGIVKSMLQHSRASGGQKEPTDVNKLVDEYVRLAYHGFRAKHKDFNVKLDLQLDPALGRVPMVAQDIGRVILNLLNNAFQAVEEKANTAGPDYQPTVTITSSSPAGDPGLRPKGHPQGNDRSNSAESANPPMRESAIIRVADNGPGISESIKDKIFQPFFTTKPTGQGTGLGLSLSYDIIKAHHGEINIQSNPGEGSSFTIRLPLSSYETGNQRSQPGLP